MEPPTGERTRHIPEYLLKTIAGVGQLRTLRVDMEKKSLQFGDFLGTAFCYPKGGYFLTAAHCILDLDPSLLSIYGAFSGETNLCLVRSVVTHPTADLAILRVDPSATCQPLPFIEIQQDSYAGDEFLAFGYPADVFGADSTKPTPRLFRGYVQRFLEYRSPLGFSYPAAEMNLAAPPGLSGGPVFKPGPIGTLLGLVTENLESVTFLHSELIKDKGGIQSQERFQTVINYGICLDLDKFRDWISENCSED